MSSPYKTLGLTLGGGGTKGFAHLGLYKVLYDNQIPIHSLAGCSIGAAIAAGIAQGKPPEELFEIMYEGAKGQGNLLHLSDIGFEKGALLKAEQEIAALKRLVPEDLTFEELKIPLVVNAVDLEKGSEVVFRSGKLFLAVQASASIPGVFPPVFLDGRLLIDGGVLNNTPVNLCRSLGADVQIAVNLKSFYTEQNISGFIYKFYLQEDFEKKAGLHIPTHFFQDTLLKIQFPLTILLRSVSIAQESCQDKIVKEAQPDLVVHPDVSAYSFLDASKCEEIYEKGIEAGKAALPKIRELLGL